MNIVFIIDYYYPHIGGVELVFQRLAEGLKKREHHVKVITIKTDNKIPSTELLNGVEIERIRTPKIGDRFFFSFLCIPTVLRAVKKADIVHTAAYSGALPAFVASRLFKRPIVFTIPEVLGSRWLFVERNPLLAYIYKFIEWVITKMPYDQLVAISNATLEDARKIRVSKEKSTCIYGGADCFNDDFISKKGGNLKKIIGAKNDDFIYLYYGRPGITKGITYLLQATTIIQKAIQNSRLVLILSKQPENQFFKIVNSVKELQNKANIHILPSFVNKSELYSYVQDADCVVIPSITEGFGLSAVEGVSLGVPVVATRAGSLPEVISGRHLLVDVASPVAIADAVIRIYHGDYDITPVRKFLWENMVMEYEKIYIRLNAELWGRTKGIN
jgi:D-inositol-3-phosphate glycosyltransferase